VLLSKFAPAVVSSCLGIFTESNPWANMSTKFEHYTVTFFFNKCKSLVANVFPISFNEVNLISPLILPMGGDEHGDLAVLALQDNASSSPAPSAAVMSVVMPSKEVAQIGPSKLLSNIEAVTKMEPQCPAVSKKAEDLLIWLQPSNAFELENQSYAHDEHVQSCVDCDEVAQIYPNKNKVFSAQNLTCFVNPFQVEAVMQFPAPPTGFSYALVVDQTNNSDGGQLPQVLGAQAETQVKGNAKGKKMEKTSLVEKTSPRARPRRAKARALASPSSSPCHGILGPQCHPTSASVSPSLRRHCLLPRHQQLPHQPRRHHQWLQGPTRPTSSGTPLMRLQAVWRSLLVPATWLDQTGTHCQGRPRPTARW
jgi:hypothetical protein